jgi:hypothetical protein
MLTSLTSCSAFMDQVNSGKIEITAEQWLAFMYDDEMGLELDNDQYGLCRGEYLACVHHKFSLHLCV